MSKKSKKFATENQVEAENQVETSSAAPAIPKRPSFFLRDADGVEYKIDKRLGLPKKAAVAGIITIDGQVTAYQVTSNKGFTKDDTVIAYSWITLPDGSFGYITHDYNTEPVNGQAYTLHEGKANRVNPERVAKDDVVGVGRVEKFKATMALRKEAAESVPA